MNEWTVARPEATLENVGGGRAGGVGEGKNNSGLEEMFVCEGWKWNHPTTQHIGYDSFFH